MRTALLRAPASQMPPRLAQSAFELFADNGFAKVNLDQIAGRAGVTKGSLYWHYKNKKELVLAACQHYYRQWQADVQAALAPSSDPLERLQRALTFSVDSCVIDRRNRLFTTGIFMLMQEDADVRTSWMQFYSAVRDFYVCLVKDAQQAGTITEGDVRRDVDLMLEAMEGLKLRAGFEPHIARSSERKAIIEGLLGVFRLGAPTTLTKRIGSRRASGRDASPNRPPALKPVEGRTPRGGVPTSAQRTHRGGVPT